MVRNHLYRLYWTTVNDGVACLSVICSSVICQDSIYHVKLNFYCEYKGNLLLLGRGHYCGDDKNELRTKIMKYADAFYFDFDLDSVVECFENGTEWKPVDIYL